MGVAQDARSRTGVGDGQVVAVTDDHRRSNEHDQPDSDQDMGSLAGPLPLVKGDAPKRAKMMMLAMCKVQLLKSYLPIFV